MRVLGLVMLAVAVVVFIPFGLLMTIDGDVRAVGQFGSAALFIYYGRRYASRDATTRAPHQAQPPT